MNGNGDLCKLTIRLEGLTVNEANKASRDLEKVLSPFVGPNGSVEIVRTDSARQDMGATLILVLGTPAAIAIAKGIHDYIAKRGNRVVIETAEGMVLATGDATKNIDIAKTAEAIRKGQ
jgi:hypothetical protein